MPIDFCGLFKPAHTISDDRSDPSDTRPHTRITHAHQADGIHPDAFDPAGESFLCQCLRQLFSCMIGTHGDDEREPLLNAGSDYAITVPVQSQQSVPAVHPCIIISGSIVHDLSIPETALPNPPETHAPQTGDMIERLLSMPKKTLMSAAGKIQFGGNAANIAYILKMCGGPEPLVVSAVGEADFGEYEAHLNRHRIDTTHIHRSPGKTTATAIIVTHADSNHQTSAYVRGAMNDSENISIPATPNARLGVITANRMNAVARHATEFHQQNIPFIFAPGQAVKGMCKDDAARKKLPHVIEQARYIALNEQEAELLCATLEQTPEQLQKHCTALIITRGNKGSRIHANGRMVEIPCYRAGETIDPTGCGDAYLAGFIHGVICGVPEGWALRETSGPAESAGKASGRPEPDIDPERVDWGKIGRFASVIAGLTATKSGGQGISFTRSQIMEHFKEYLHLSDVQ